MKTNIIDKQQKWLLKKFHTLCGRLGMSTEEKRAMIFDNFGVESSADISINELLTICFALEKQLNPDLQELDRWRKRAMAAIGGYLQATGQQNTCDKIKAIACRASGYDNFNKIPKQRLIDIYYAFKNKQKTFKQV
ncbi:MAG: hypothetical protein LBT56_04025, partial [Prevotellaceae bacterium]|nr:hypothetical protein [Prevotellaceae bacterium]